MLEDAGLDAPAAAPPRVAPPLVDLWGCVGVFPGGGFSPPLPLSVRTLEMLLTLPAELLGLSLSLSLPLSSCAR